MTTDEVLTEIRERGITFAVRDGKPVLRGDKKRITPTLLAVIRWHRAEILERLERLGCQALHQSPPAPRNQESQELLSEDAVAAIAERAYHDEPDWENGICQRQSVIVQAEGWPVLALPPDFVKWWLRHNEIARSRAKLENP